MLNSITTYVTQEKKAIGVGIGCYMISLFLVIFCLIILVNPYTSTSIFAVLFGLLLIEVLFSLPAIPSALVASHLSKKQNAGIYTVGISGVLVVTLVNVIVIVFVLPPFLQAPPTDQYEELGRMLTFYPFFLNPISAISAILTVISERAYFYFSPPSRLS